MIKACAWYDGKRESRWEWSEQDEAQFEIVRKKSCDNREANVDDI
jgi:hypothetical protein